MKCYINLKFFANLAKIPLKNTNNIQIKPGTTIRDLMLDFGIKPEKIKLIFVNGIKQEISTKLKNGDRVGIFPPIGGG